MRLHTPCRRFHASGLDPHASALTTTHATSRRASTHTIHQWSLFVQMMSSFVENHDCRSDQKFANLGSFLCHFPASIQTTSSSFQHPKIIYFLKTEALILFVMKIPLEILILGSENNQTNTDLHQFDPNLSPSLWCSKNSQTPQREMDGGGNRKKKRQQWWVSLQITLKPTVPRTLGPLFHTLIKCLLGGWVCINGYQVTQLGQHQVNGLLKNQGKFNNNWAKTYIYPTTTKPKPTPAWAIQKCWSYSNRVKSMVSINYTTTILNHRLDLFGIKTQYRDS